MPSSSVSSSGSGIVAATGSDRLQVEDLAVVALDHRPEGPAQLRIGARGDQQRVPRGVHGGPARGPQQQHAVLESRLSELLQRGTEGRELASAHLLRGRDHELEPRLEVTEQPALGHPGPPADLGRRRAGVPALAQ